MINTPLVRQYFPTQPHTNQATQTRESETLRKQQQIGLVSGCGWKSFIWFVSTVVEVIWVLNEVENPSKMF